MLEARNWQQVSTVLVAVEDGYGYQDQSRCELSTVLVEFLHVFVSFSLKQDAHFFASVKVGSMKFRTTMSLLAGLTFGAALSQASGISYTCAANIDALGPANTCTTLDTTIAGLYNSTFANANASIYIQYGTTGLGQSSQYLNFVDYSTYRSDVSPAARASLPTAEPSLYNGDQVEVTAALGTALGLTGMTGTTAAGSACFTPGSGGCYDAVITLATPAIVAGYGEGYYYRSGLIASNQYDIFTVVEHETDEVLGTSSCVDTSGPALANGCGGSSPSAVDLFRFNGAGNRVLIDTTPGAYFSTDDGATNGAAGAIYNTVANGNDYADFVSNCQFVQDGTGCLGGAGLDITNDGGAEINILDTVGYTLTPSVVSPEPGAFWLVCAGFPIVALLRRRLTAK